MAQTRPPIRQPTLRQGRRPLPLHLGTLMLSCLSSSAALALWNSGSLPWKRPLAGAAAALKAQLDGVDREDFAAAVEQAARSRLDRFMGAVQSYRRHPYRRELPDAPVLWQGGAVRLLDHGPALPADAPVLLLVPSLVNRGFILDLGPGRSLVRWLADEGIRPLLIDWGRPGAAELEFS